MTVKNKQFAEYATGGLNIGLTIHMVRALNYAACGEFGSRPEYYMERCYSLETRGLIERRWYMDWKTGMRKSEQWLTEEGYLVRELCIRAGLVERENVGINVETVVFPDCYEHRICEDEAAA